MVTLALATVADATSTVAASAAILTPVLVVRCIWCVPTSWW